MIQYIAENVKMPALQKQRINRWIKEIADGYGKKTGDIAYVFCDDQKILEVNNQYLEHDYYTDIITFDYTTGNTISGDIFISLDTVKSNADEYGADFETELHRILIHGILHLCGNDDKSPELRADMTNKENKALGQLKLMH
ncbi:MAG: rRNA maturation RNase YbeY [Paludibacter sp.]|jgi:rRNA maturation RNase YbeY|nr:rRNA maturation RNase YbeY [Paludibacter sp.]MEA4849844.1 rRNA maturation RNase YbeY [Paludibacter sp.]